MAQDIDWEKGSFSNPAGSEPDWETGAFSEPETPKRGLKGWAQDIVAGALDLAMGVPEAAVGLLDIPTGGRAGKALEDIGVRFKDAKAITAGMYSDATQAGEKKFKEAEGIGGKFQAAIENPSVIVKGVGTSLGAMGAGGALAKGIGLAAPALAGRAGLAAAGEGAVMAGSQAESIRQQTDDGLLTAKQSALAAGTGLAGGAIGALGAKAAKSLGIGDVDTMIANGATQGAAREGLGLVNRVGRGALSEGVLEELPQSLTETALGNIALDRNVSEGMDEAAVLGTLSGGLMGGAAGALSRPAVKPSQAMGIDPAAGPLSRAAATAVDSGATPTIQPEQVNAEQAKADPAVAQAADAAEVQAADAGQDRGGMDGGELLPASSSEGNQQPVPVVEPLPLEARSLDELRQSLRNAQDPAIRKTVAAEIRRRRESMPDPLSQPQQEPASVVTPPESIQASQKESPSPTTTEGLTNATQAETDSLLAQTPDRATSQDAGTVGGSGAEQAQQVGTIAGGRSGGVVLRDAGPAVETADRTNKLKEATNVSTTPDSLRNGSNGSSGAGPNLADAGLANDVGVPDGTAGTAAPVVPESVQPSAGDQPAPGKAALKDRRYNLVAINEKSGAKTLMNSSPMSHQEAVTMKNKTSVNPARRVQLEEISATSDRPERWRQNALQAGKVARTLGLEPKGKRLAQIVAEIDAKDGNVQNAPQAANDGQAKAAPVEASTAERGDAASNGAVSAAGQDAGVRSDGVTDVDPVIARGGRRAGEYLAEKMAEDPERAKRVEALRGRVRERLDESSAIIAKEREQVAKSPAEPVNPTPPTKKNRQSMQEKVERPAKDDEVVATTGKADAEGERKFYVTMVRGDRVARLAGPFDTKEEADAMVRRAQDAANTADPRSAFDAFGVSAVTAKDHKPGTLNGVLGISPQPKAEKPVDAQFSVADGGVTESEAFKKWFGDSKVVDADGKPLRVFHGTPNASFTEFKEGAHFTEDPDYAAIYTNPSASSINSEAKRAEAPATMPVYLSIKKPFDTRIPSVKRVFDREFFGQWGNGTPLSERGLPDWTDARDILEWIEETGQPFDGVLIDEGGTPDGGHRGFSWVPVKNTQIKSATGNRGTFDPSTPDIRLDASAGEATATTYTPAPDAQQKAVTAFADRLSKNRDSFVPMDAVKPSGARAKEAQSVSDLAKTMFGREAVFVKFKGRPLFNGAVSTTDPGKIFVNIESARPMMAVLGHELLHELRKSNPTAYAQLAKTLKTVTKDDYIYEALLKKKYRDQGLNWTPQDISEELYGDIVGDNFMDPKFWEAIAGDKPIFAKQLYRAVMNWLDKIASMFKRVKVRQDGGMVMTLAEQADGSRPFGTQKYLQDIEAARVAVAQAMGQFKQGGKGKDALSIADRQDQTDTPAFKKWFGDSKVVDSAGKPLVVYHGTKGNFNSFDESKQGTSDFGASGRGFYFSQDPASANLYATLSPADGSPNIIPAYVSLKNPYEMGAMLPRNEAESRLLTENVKAAGHDGIIVRGADGVLDEVIVFRPEQIKSATGNRGTFDPEDADIRFSIADAVEQISPQAAVKPVVQFLNDTFKVRGKLHWWHKTVGTPFNLAERVPEFKRVFNAVQDFITSVSFYGAEAAAMAPKIIPKLESWKDLGKSPISAADNKAIASPIFEGTLSWRRDSTGKPVLADSVEEAGIVWTDEELRSKFLLTDEQIELYREFRAATDKSLTGLALSDMLQFAGDDAKPIRDVVMGMSLKEGSETLSKYLKALAAGEEKTRKAILLDTANTVMDRADKAQSLIDRGYAPLQRFGRHTIYAKNAKGEQLFFGMYEDRWAAGRAARQMREQYPDATVEIGMMSEQSYKMFQGISPETLELFGTMLGMDANADGESNKAFQMYLKLAKSNRSALKRLIERKGISGYSEDAIRVLASFIYSNARQTSTNLHVGDIMNSVDDIPRDMGDAKDAAMKLARYTMDPQEEAQALRGLLFAQYLGGSIASAAINALQPAQVTFPYLSQFVGAKRSAVLMGGAVKDALKKTTGDAKLDAELKKAEEEGIVSPQEIFQLMAQAQGKATLKAGDGTTAGDAAATASNTLSRLSLGWGKVFSIPEQFNRRTTFIAAYRTAQEKGESNPYDFAKQAVKETQLVYNKGNRPEWARGTVGALAFTFKTYSISYVELLQRMATNGPEGRRAAMLMIATLMLMAGAGGLPGIEDAENVVDGIAQRVFGLNFQSRQKRQEWLAEIFGEGGARFIENGLSGLPWSPTDVSGRLGLGNLIPGTGVFVKKQDYSRDIAEIAGPAADMTKRFLQGAGLLLQGEVLKAGEIVAPAAVRNMIQGARMGATDQYSDTKGRKVIDTTPTEALTKFIGFQPADVARVQESTGTLQQMIALNKIRESEIADKWAKGLASKDQEQIQEARDELLKWNRANPDSPIRINMSQIFKRVKALNEDKATRIARTAPKEIRQDVRRELESNQ